MRVAPLALLSLSLAATNVSAQELLANGDLETGDATGWTITNSVMTDGDFLVVPAGPLPLSGDVVVDPFDAYHAVTDQDGPGAYAHPELHYTGVPGRLSGDA
jgi:hypothetical protein